MHLAAAYGVGLAIKHTNRTVEVSALVINQQFGFQKTRLRRMTKNRYKINLLAVLTNLFLVQRQLLVMA